MEKYLVILCILIVNETYAQQDIKLPLVGEKIEDFIPEGYKTMAEVKGDLNKDSVDDVVLVLYNARLEDDVNLNVDTIDVEYDTVRRPVVVLFREQGRYRLAAKAMNIVWCKTCGGAFGDPYADTQIENGVLEIGHYGGSAWRWSDSRKFRYQKGDFYLIGETHHSFWINGDCEDISESPGIYEDVNLLTGDRELKEISEDCKILVDKKDKIKRAPLIKMVDYNIYN